MYLDVSEKVQDYKLKQRRLCVPFFITGSATAASKVVSSDLQVVYVRTEGLTAAADAVDSGGNFTTPDDNGGGGAIFGVLLAPGKAITRVLRIAVEQRTGTTATNKVQATSLAGASSTGITASGNIAFNITAAGLDLSSENFDGVAIIEYMVEQY